MDLVTAECLDDGVVPWVRDVLHQVLEWSFPGNIVLNHKSQECQHCQSSVSKLLLLVFFGRSKVQWVEDATRVATVMFGQAVLLEDGVLVDTAWVLNVLPPSDLDVVEQDEFDHKECR